MTAAPDPRRLLAPIGAERFLADHWQKRMVSFPLAADEFAAIQAEVGPLDVTSLAASAQEGAQAWIANQYVAHSVVPVDATNASQFAAIGATLYFVNVPLPRLTDAFADFLGAPRQKVIASLFLTPPAGGASPHFDKNENFTIQLTGAKRWHVGETPMVASPPDGLILGQTPPPSLAGLLAAKEPPRRTVEMRPGTLLYVPRGTVHATEAGEQSWSLNISYSPAMWLDLMRVGLRRRLARSERWRGTVSGVGGMAACPLPELVAELREMLADAREVESLARYFLEQPYD